jgi:hypothetical protein|nr:MAG TPA: hypothetical protein [Caudoviricetes sp.]
MNRAERRRLKRQEENMRAEQIVNKAIDNLLNKFYITMRENNISKDRANRILSETAKRL